MTMQISVSEELAANLAFTHQKAGSAGLREVLEAIATARSSVASYEIFAGIAEELRSTGLSVVAEDLDELACEIFPHEWELPCPHPPDCTSLIEDWQQEMEQKKENSRIASKMAS